MYLPADIKIQISFQESKKKSHLLKESIKKVTALITHHTVL